MKKLLAVLKAEKTSALILGGLGMAITANAAEIGNSITNIANSSPDVLCTVIVAAAVGFAAKLANGLYNAYTGSYKEKYAVQTTR